MITDIKYICAIYNIKNYTINDDNSIDVDDDVNLTIKKLTKLPLNFNKVTGYFACGSNNLISLNGCPKYIGKSFSCVYNNLNSFEGCPEYVGNDFYISNNNITNLDGFSKYIGGNLHCRNNPIEYLYNNYIKSIDNIELFNEFKIINGKSINIKRLNNYIDLNNYNEVDKNELIKIGYNVI